MNTFLNLIEAAKKLQLNAHPGMNDPHFNLEISEELVESPTFHRVGDNIKIFFNANERILKIKYAPTDNDTVLAVAILYLYCSALEALFTKIVIASVQFEADSQYSEGPEFHNVLAILKNAQRTTKIEIVLNSPEALVYAHTLLIYCVDADHPDQFHFLMELGRGHQLTKH